MMPPAGIYIIQSPRESTLVPVRCTYVLVQGLERAEARSHVARRPITCALGLAGCMQSSLTHAVRAVPAASSEEPARWSGGPLTDPPSPTPFSRSWMGPSVTGSCPRPIVAPRGLLNGPPGAPAVRMGCAHSWVAAQPTVMSWYVAVNTLFTLPTPPAGGSREAIFRIFGR